MKLVDGLYAHAPVWAQNLGATVYGAYWYWRRYGPRFGEAARGFREREWWSADRMTQYVEGELRRLLAHAVTTVPHYRATLRIAPSEIERLRIEDLPKLPLLEKETIRNGGESFVTELGQERRGGSYYLTSGSTGTPLGILFTPRMHQSWTAAYETRCRNWAGVGRKDSRAMIGGRIVVPRAVSSPPYWRYNRFERQLYMSAFHISPETAPTYAEAIRKHQSTYLVGYASSHYFLARLLSEQGIRVSGPKAVLTSSEKLTQEMRAVITSVYGCPVFDGYSGVEACCLAAECEQHQLHISPDVGIVELVDENGVAVSPGTPGEIVATGLLNFSQPLIRYRTGDVAVLSSDPCPCGRPLPVLRELVGRLEDTVIGPDGREMVRFHGLYVGLSSVREGQVVQESVDEIRLRVVATASFSERERQTLIERVRQRLGDVRVQVELVDALERTKRGKLRAVVSRVARKKAAC